MKIIKPDNLAFLSRNFRWAQRQRVAIGMMGFFNFGSSSLDNLLSEAQMWPAASGVMGKNCVLDDGLPKTNGEFLVYGSAHTPNGQRLAQLPASARVGLTSKTLYVSGERRFTGLGLISDAQTFTSTPMGFEQSFGGEGCAANPLGKGFSNLVDAAGKVYWPLPNVESPASLMLEKTDQPVPAGFWALPAHTAQRQSLLGRFDERWLQKNWPHLPDDTSPDYFQTAQLDQRINGFFRGDEPLELTHMHPRKPLLAGTLPQLRARCFVNRRVAGEAQFAEIEARAETVWLFPEIECGIVLYRAVADVTQEDAEDLLHVMAAWERMADAPLPFAHYEKVFSRGQSGASAEFASSTPVQTTQADAAPALLAAPAALPAGAGLAASAAAAVSDPSMLALEKMVSGVEAEVAALVKKSGVSQESTAPFMVPPAPLPRLSMPELEKLVAEIEGNVESLLKENKLTQEQLASFIPPPPSNAGLSLGDLKATMLQIEQQTASLLKKNGMTEQSIQSMLASRPETAHLATGLTDSTGSLEQIFADLSAAAQPTSAMAVTPLLATVLAPPKLPDALPPPEIDRNYVIARHARKQSFSGMDLSGLDLSGLDLAGADFSATLLEKTSFKGSKLAGSVFSHSMLAGGDFSDAELGRARLNGVSADAACFVNARLNGVDASNADFTGADFSAAQLSQGRFDNTIFDRARMAGVQADACIAGKASFAGCDLTGANFKHAQLTAAVFAAAKMGKSDFANAVCDNAEFAGVDASQATFTDTSLRASRADDTSQFASAKLQRAQLDRASWEGVMLGKADFQGAVLDDADFSRVKALEANFGRVSAKGARFDKSDLTGADLRSANFFKASLRHTVTEAALLHKANLYGVDFYGSSPSLATLADANIGQTLLSIRKPFA